MPHYTRDNILAVYYDELVPRFYKPESLWAIVSRDEKRGYGLKRLSRGGNGRQAEIEFDSLPKHIRCQLDDPRVGRHVLEAFFEVDTDAVAFYRSFRFGDGRSIREDLQGVYAANASVIQAVLRLREARIVEITNKGHRPKRVWEHLHHDAMTFCYLRENKDIEDCKDNKDTRISVLKRVFGMECDLPKNPKRFKEKCEMFAGMDGDARYLYLINDRHGNQNARVNEEKTQRLLESLFAGVEDKPNYAEVSRLYDAFLSGYKDVINNDTGELYNPKEFKPLSEASIKLFLSRWDSKIGTHAARSGDRQKYMGQFKVAHSMKKSQYAGSLISVDDRQPPFRYREGGTSATNRVWFYVAVDHASECYIAWVHGKTKEGLITEFYRQIARNCHAMNVGIPLELECESSLNSAMRDGLLREGNMFKYVRMEANNARGKFVESYHGQMRYQTERHLPGFIARHYAELESNQPGPNKPAIIPYETIVEQTVRNMQNHNNQPHSIHTDKTRMQVWLEMQNPQINTNIDWHGILPYIGKKTRSSCKVGQVILQDSEWLLGDFGEIYFGERLINLMNLIEGEQMDVFWLDDNEGGVMKALACVGGQFVCELLPKPVYVRARAEQTEEDLKAREVMSKYAMAVEAFANRKRKAIQKVTVIDTAVPVNTAFDINSLIPTAGIGTSAVLDGVQDAVVVTMPEPDDENENNYDLIGVETEIKHRKRSLKNVF